MITMTKGLTKTLQANDPNTLFQCRNGFHFHVSTLCTHSNTKISGHWQKTNTSKNNIMHHINQPKNVLFLFCCDRLFRFAVCTV